MPLSAQDTSEVRSSAPVSDGPRACGRQWHEPLLRVSGQVMYECDLGGGKMVFCGDVEGLLGFPASEFHGDRRQWTKHIHPDDRARFTEVKAAAAADGEPHCQEYRFHRKDGVVVWLRDTCCLIRDEPSGRLLLAGALRNITEERNLWAQLEHLQKKQLLGELAGGIAHDFNNLLTVFNGYTEMLQAEIGPKDPRRVFLDEMASAVERGKGLTSQLLHFSRFKPAPAGLYPLDSLLLELCKLLRRIVGENIEFVTQIGKDRGWVVADPSQIETLIFNLVLNACAAMPKGGRLGIELSPAVVRRTDRRVEAGWKPGPYVQIAVSDTGIGMDEALREKIFEPYFTTKTQGHGSGLGLSICSGIVERSGGKIAVDSVPGKGSTFRIFLPGVRSPVGQNNLVEGVVRCEAPRGKGEKLLIVEDDRAALKTLAAMLRGLGYRVLCAANGDEALRIVEAEDEIHLVISDLVMPLIGGIDFAQTLRDRWPEIRVVLTSGYTHELLELNAQKPSPAFFLPKPLSRNVLAHKLREILDV